VDADQLIRSLAGDNQLIRPLDPAPRRSYPVPLPNVRLARGASDPDEGVAAVTIARPRELELQRVAIQLFRERGFHATSMQDLADALGMHRGSLYHYIAAKDDLLWTIVSGALERLDAHVRPELDGPGRGVDRVRRAITAHLRFAAGQRDELSLTHIELRSLHPERRRELVERRDAYERAWRDALAAGVADGSFRPIDVRLAGFMILSTCNWFTQWYRPDGPLSVEELAETLADLLLDGLRAPIAVTPTSHRTNKEPDR
jgi:AcrR family transcriptional regulator